MSSNPRTPYSSRLMGSTKPAVGPPPPRINTNMSTRSSNPNVMGQMQMQNPIMNQMQMQNQGNMMSPPMGGFHLSRRSIDEFSPPRPGTGDYGRHARHSSTASGNSPHSRRPTVQVNGFGMPVNGVTPRHMKAPSIVSPDGFKSPLHELRTPRGHSRGKSLANELLQARTASLHRPSMSMNTTEYFRLVYDVMHNEEEYVADLNLFVHLFVKPAEQKSRHLKVNLEDLRGVFGNYEQLLNLNIVFLSKLQEIVKDLDGQLELALISVATLFGNLEALLKMYVMYSLNAASASGVLAGLMSNSNFAEFITNQENHPNCNGKNLQYFLHLPLARVAAYRRHIESIVKQMDILTNRSDSWYESRMLLLNTMDAIDECMQRMNIEHESRNDRSELEKIQSEFGSGLSIIAPGRKFLRRGKFYLLVDWAKDNVIREGDELEFFLFSDVLIYVTYSGFFNSKKKFHVLSFGAEHVCEETADSVTKFQNVPPLLQVGLPSSLPVAQFGKPPLIIQFPDRSTLNLWKKNICESIRKCAASHAEKLRVARDENHSSVVPHFYVANRMEGVLYKYKVGHGFGTFKKRFCVLRQQILTYYESEEDMKSIEEPLGTLSFRYCFVEEVPTGKYDIPYCFELFSPETRCKYVFGSMYEDALQEWLNFIKAESAKGIEEQQKIEAMPVKKEERFHGRDASRNMSIMSHGSRIPLPPPPRRR